MTRNRNKIDGDGKEEIYKDFIEKNPGTPISKDEYFNIVEGVHDTLFQVICERKYTVRLSHILGSFHLLAYKPTKDKHRVIDFKTSKEVGKKVYFRNSHSDGIRFRIHHERKTIPFSLNHIFKFKPHRDIQRGLAKLIKSKKIPTWT